MNREQRRRNKPAEMTAIEFQHHQMRKMDDVQRGLLKGIQKRCSEAIKRANAQLEKELFGVE